MNSVMIKFLTKLNMKEKKKLKFKKQHSKNILINVDKIGKILNKKEYKHQVFLLKLKYRI